MPVTSTKVATKGLDAMAGSMPKRLNIKGRIEPISQRHKQGKHSDFLEFIVKVSHRREGEHLRDEQCGQPDDPLPPHLYKARFEIVLGNGRDAGLSLQVLRRLRLNDVNHIVVRHDPD